MKIHDLEGLYPEIDLSRYTCPVCGEVRPVATLAREHCRGVEAENPLHIVPKAV